MPRLLEGDLIRFFIPGSTPMNFSEGVVLHSNIKTGDLAIGLDTGDKVQTNIKSIRYERPRLVGGSIARTQKHYKTSQANLAMGALVMVLESLDGYCYVCPMELVEPSGPSISLEIRSDWLWPIVGEYVPGKKVVVGDERRSGKILAIDPEGIVVEYTDPVGQHSYDGMGKSGHCDIVDKSQLEIQK